MLTPFGRTRYHLNEYSQRPPETPEELFNHRHSSLRNSIEMAFGVLKKRFTIMASGFECHFSSTTMTDIVLACYVLHNFMLFENTVADGYITSESVMYAVEERGADNQVDSQLNNAYDTGNEYLQGHNLRAKIASEMLSAYCTHRDGNTLRD